MSPVCVIGRQSSRYKCDGEIMRFLIGPDGNPKHLREVFLCEAHRDRVKFIDLVGFSQPHDMSEEQARMKITPTKATRKTQHLKVTENKT